VQNNQKTLHRQIRSGFKGKRHIFFVATNREISQTQNFTRTLGLNKHQRISMKPGAIIFFIVKLEATDSRNGM